MSVHASEAITYFNMAHGITTAEERFSSPARAATGAPKARRSDE
ncbi:hypothetical protein [Chromohalobacter japonicus]|nr:hypothetical protein [Chromohalobacter japonicus]